MPDQTTTTPDADLAAYDLHVTQAVPGGPPTIVAVCTRSHARSGPWVGAVLRDLAGDQSGLTLAELVDHCREHEDDQHPPAIATLTGGDHRA